MGTRIVKLRGIGYWAKVFEFNRDLTGYEGALADVGGQTSIDVDLDKDMYDLLVKSKSMKKGVQSPDNEGMTRVKFTRKWENQFSGGPPTVVGPDNKPWDPDNQGLIGNGSEVLVELVVYDTKRRGIVGTRLERVKVLNHVEYVGADYDTPGIKEYTKKPKPGDTPSSKADEELDDEIPF
jgi:hypothetical protein